MSINPIPAVTMHEVRSDAGRHPAGSARAVQPNSGTSPNQNIHRSQPTPTSADMAEDEVQVQREDPINGEIVIRYVDHSGKLILQVPSAQVLDVARGIEQSLKDTAKSRNEASVTSPGTEGGQHGH